MAMNYPYQGVSEQSVFSGAASPSPAPTTLTSAIGSFENLSGRLGDMLSKAHQIATAVGGPFPVGAGQAKNNPPSESAVMRLNELSSRAHQQVDELNECLAALARSLGV